MICVVECPEFWQLCMVLWESLSDADIPHCDKVSQAIINHWQKLFEDMRCDLSVSLNIFVSNSYKLILINSSLKGRSVLLQMFGEAPT